METHAPQSRLRYFLTYRGVKLPLQLCEELAPGSLTHRNTYFRAAYDPQDRLLWLEKIVYGEVEMRHDYRWHPDGGPLAAATIQVGDDEPREIVLGG